VTRALALLALLSLGQQAWAIDSDAPLPDAARQALYEQLTEEVRCLVCQNQTLADSTAPLAADLRREIRGLVEEGASETEVKEFLTARYGDFVLYRPRYTGLTALLWLAPVALLLGGGTWLWRIVRRRSGLPVTTDDEDRIDP
jgi:cytochrome c-type biogenesis protein CcmH